MIQIIGDTFEELADLQTLLEAGKLNYHEKKIKVYATFKLSSGGTLIYDQYGHIVGSNEPNQDFRSMKIF
jgi:hypothetical protein